jgi:hypothetical protein
MRKLSEFGEASIVGAFRNDGASCGDGSAGEHNVLLSFAHLRSGGRDSAGADVTVASAERGGRVGGEVVLIEPRGLGSVPMRPPRGVCGLTVSEIELGGGGVASWFRGVWRAEFGAAAESAGDVVVELADPRDPWPGGPRGSDAAADKRDWVQVRLLVAARGRGRSYPRWLWLGRWPRLGTDWPYVVAPLVMIVMEQERRAATRTGATCPGPSGDEHSR